MKIAVVGDIGVDYYENLDQYKPGGIAFNFVYNLVQAGNDASLVSILGDEVDSQQLVGIIKKLKLKTSLQKTKAKAPQQKIQLRNGERKFTGYSAGVLKEWKLTKKDVDFISKYDAVFVPLTDGMEGIFEAVKKIRGLVKVVDFSQDYEFADFNKKENVITANAQFFDIIFVGGDRKHKPMISKLAKKHPEKVFVLTLGKYGSIAFHENSEYFQPAKKVKVVDTTGAGDAFQAIFLTTFLKSKDIIKSLKAGTNQAAKVIRYVGSTKLSL